MSYDSSIMYYSSEYHFFVHRLHMRIYVQRTLSIARIH